MYGCRLFSIHGDHTIDSRVILYYHTICRYYKSWMPFTACPAGTYRPLLNPSSSCLSCPTNTNTSGVAVAFCPCIAEFFRSTQDGPHIGCTRKSHQLLQKSLHLKIYVYPWKQAYPSLKLLQQIFFPQKYINSVVVCSYTQLCQAGRNYRSTIVKVVGFTTEGRHKQSLDKSTIGLK